MPGLVAVVVALAYAVVSPMLVEGELSLLSELLALACPGAGEPVASR